MNWRNSKMSFIKRLCISSFAVLFLIQTLCGATPVSQINTFATNVAVETSETQEEAIALAAEKAAEEEAARIKAEAEALAEQMRRVEEEIARTNRIAEIDEAVSSITDSMYYVDRMDRAHELAEMARAEGLTDDNPIIVKCRDIWWKAYDEFCYDRDIIATVVYNEAWYKCSDRHRELVAGVVVNRRDDTKWFGSVDTIYEVVVAPYQYNPKYAKADSYHGRIARENPENWAVCQESAARALRYEIDIPSTVLFQAEFVPGDEIYEIHKIGYSTTYFCHKY